VFDLCISHKNSPLIWNLFQLLSIDLLSYCFLTPLFSRTMSLDCLHCIACQIVFPLWTQKLKFGFKNGAKKRGYTREKSGCKWAYLSNICMPGTSARFLDAFLKVAASSCILYESSFSFLSIMSSISICLHLNFRLLGWTKHKAKVYFIQILTK